MVKLVGVVGGDMMRSGEGARECLARRQITLGIEADLKMVVALDDNCLACGLRTGTSSSRTTGGKQYSAVQNLKRGQ